MAVFYSFAKQIYPILGYLSLGEFERLHEGMISPHYKSIKKDPVPFL